MTAHSRALKTLNETGNSMAQKDYRVNEHGINVLDLKPGQWITVRYCGRNDVSFDVRCLLLAVQDKPHNYKGIRDLRVFEENEDGTWQVSLAPMHDQVVAIHGFLNTDSVPLK